MHTLVLVIDKFNVFNFIDQGTQLELSESVLNEKEEELVEMRDQVSFRLNK